MPRSRISMFLRRTSVLAAIVALGAVGLSLGTASPAKAYPVKTCTLAHVCVFSCAQAMPDGAVIEYPEGTQITITFNGKEMHATCRGGYWYPSRTTLTLSDIVALTGGGVVMVAATCPDTVRVCPPAERSSWPRS